MDGDTRNIMEKVGRGHPFRNPVFANNRDAVTKSCPSALTSHASEKRRRNSAKREHFEITSPLAEVKAAGNRRGSTPSTWTMSVAVACRLRAAIGRPRLQSAA